jgi:cytochrome P450
VDDFITFLNAGQETTANALAFCLLELDKNPHIRAKLTNEINLVLGERNNVTFDDLTNLEYLECTLKETLRKYPPAVQFMREINEEEYSINGINFPRGTWVAISPFALGRNPKFFEDPECFRPERFFRNASQK